MIGSSSYNYPSGSFVTHFVLRDDPRVLTDLIISPPYYSDSRLSRYARISLSIFNIVRQ